MLSLALLLSLLVSSCESSAPTSRGQGQSPAQSTLASGNGGGYEGLNRQYYRFIPGYSCEGTPSSKEVVAIGPDGVRLFDNKVNQCDAVGRLLSESELGYSPFERDFAVVANRLFKLYPDKPAGIPSSLAELLCRDDYDHPSFEIVTHYDRERNQALGRVYFAGSSEPDFEVSRLLSSDHVRYVSDRLTFSVNLSSSSQRYSGQIEGASIPGIAANQSLTCVIGGSLDTSNWKIREAPVTATWSAISLLNDDLLFLRGDPADPNLDYHLRLYRWQRDGSVMDFSTSILGVPAYVKSFIPNMDPKMLIMQVGGLATDNYYQSYLYDAVSGHTTRLTGLGAAVVGSDYIQDGPLVAGNGNLIYSEDTYYQFALRAVVPATGEMTEIETVQGGRDSFNVLPKSNQVVVGDTSGKLRIFDLITHGWTNLVPSVPGSCAWGLFPTQPFGDENYILALAGCGVSTASGTYLVSVQDGSVIGLGDGNRIVTWSSEDRRWLIASKATYTTVTDPRTGQEKQVLSYSDHKLIDTLTGSSTSISLDPMFGYDNPYSPFGPYSSYSQADYPPRMAMADGALYGFKGSASDARLYRYDVASGTSQEVCSNALGNRLMVGALPNHKVFVFTYDTGAKVYRFYQVKSPSECVRINEFPDANPFPTSFIAIDRGFVVSIGNRGSGSSLPPSAEVRDIVFVPVDGRPPLKLNPSYGKPWSALVTSDGNRVFYSGPFSGNEWKIFSFDLNSD